MQRILVGLDGSPRAPFVLDTAVDLARRTGSKLILLRAVSLPVEIPLGAYYAMTPDAFAKSIEESARGELAKLAARVPTELLQGSEVHAGSPWETICDVAKQHDVDLIMIGSHGYTGLDRLIGTTAARVVNHSDRSVMVVRTKPV